MKSRLLMLALLTVSAISMGCQRRPGDVMEDTKTASRYVGKSLKSLVGVHDDSMPLASDQRLGGPVDEDFVPLRDEDLIRQIAAGDKKALQQIDQHMAIPQSRLVPGEPGSGLPGIDKFREPSGELAQVFQRIYFDTDDDVVRGAENEQVIWQIAEYLKSHPNVYVFIEGHCDQRGTAAYNFALGSGRSNSIRNLLIREGVDMDRILTISYGYERPLSMGSGVEDWAQNRRGQFRLFEKQDQAR